MTETVCSACLSEACLAGILMCEEARMAGTIMRERIRRCGPGPPDPPPWTGPTSDPGTWVPVAPNTAMGARAALRLAARRNREAGRADDGQVCDELADRLDHALRRARTEP